MNFLARLGETPPDPGNEDYKDLIDMAADVIIDMAAGSGGNCELTKKDETIIYKQKRIIGNVNLASGCTETNVSPPKNLFQACPPY